MIDPHPTSDPATRTADIDLALLDLLRELDQAPDLAAMYRAADDTIARLVDFDRIAIGSYDPATRRLRVQHLRGHSLGLPDHYETLPADEQSLVAAPLTQAVTVLHTLRPDRDMYRGDAMRRAHGMTQTLIAPIVAGGTVTGLIMLNSRSDDRYSVEAATLVEAIARTLGLALAARSVSGTPPPTSQVIADTLGQIAMADSAADMLDCLYHGVGRTTGATLLRFDRRPDGEYTFAGSATPAEARIEELEPDVAGPAIAGALSTLIDAAVGTDTVPQRAIVTDLPLDDPAPARVHPLETLPELAGVGAAVVTPLHASREVLGALVALWPETLAPERLPDHARTLFSFSDIAGPALHRLVLLHRLEQRLAETETIRRLTDSIARTPKLRDALDIICRTTKLVTGVDFVAIVEVGPDHVVWHSASGARSSAFLHRRLPGPAGVLGRLLAHQQEVLLEDARHHPEFSPEAMPVHASEGLRSTAIIPVYVNARVRAAVVFAWRRPHSFTSDELATFHALAATAATALASADARMRTDGD